MPLPNVMLVVAVLVGVGAVEVMVCGGNVWLWRMLLLSLLMVVVIVVVVMAVVIVAGCCGVDGG